MGQPPPTRHQDPQQHQRKLLTRGDLRLGYVPRSKGDKIDQTQSPTHEKTRVVCVFLFKPRPDAQQCGTKTVTKGHAGVGHPSFIRVLLGDEGKSPYRPNGNKQHAQARQPVTPQRHLKTHVFWRTKTPGLLGPGFRNTGLRKSFFDARGRFSGGLRLGRDFSSRWRGRELWGQGRRSRWRTIFSNRDWGGYLDRRWCRRVLPF